MPCNARNHPSTCNCGWGGKWHGNLNKRYAVNPISASVKFYRPAKELCHASSGSIFGSITRPNAKCPVCSVSVFFYQNKFGSKVFFDDLGPPWPKHPCTDNPRWRADKVHQILAPAKPPRPRAAFLNTDWGPNLLACLPQCQTLDERIIVLEDIRTGNLVKLFSAADITTPLLGLMYLRVRQQGRFEVSYIDFDSGRSSTFFAVGAKVEADEVLTEFEMFRHRIRSYERKIKAEKEIDIIRRTKV